MPVHFEARDHVAIITLDRPEARNAVNGDVAAGMEAALDRFEADEALWVGIVRAEGPVFCAGADLKEVSAGNSQRLRTERGGFGGIVRRERSKPLIAAVNGPALAGGCEVVLACDLAVAAESARFGLPEVKRSLVATAGGVFRLPRAVGRAAAMEMVLTGEPIDAHRAYDLGMINQVVPDAELMQAALALAARITVNAPLAVRESRRIVAAAHAESDETLWAMSEQAGIEIRRTEDFQEGPRAFVEKRPPVWKGR
ncbi:MAG: crotonase/enoyl-CoA hydratase family protein [Burkholderiaceae bacterium]